jgi:hypothetical protein
MAVHLPFTFHAFRPKAVNETLIVAGLLTLASLTKPSHLFLKRQWLFFVSRENV